MTKIKLAEALLRRKELQMKVDQLKTLDARELFETRVKRQTVMEGVDDIVATVPKLTAQQVTHEYDWYARQLRLCDATIQQANWTTEIVIPDTVIGEYQPPK